MGQNRSTWRRRRIFITNTVFKCVFECVFECLGGVCVYGHVVCMVAGAAISMNDLHIILCYSWI